jgi:hypothetical protein
MTKNIAAHIKQYQSCLCYNVEKENYYTIKSVVASVIWDHIETDFIGPLPTSEKRYSYIFTVVNVCSNYIVIQALYNKEIETVA